MDIPTFLPIPLSSPLAITNLFSISIITLFQKCYTALACVAQLVGVSSHKQSVMGLIRCQGSYLGFGFGPRLRGVTRGNQLKFLSHINVSLLSLPPFFPLKSVSMSLGEDLKNVIQMESCNIILLKLA